MSRLDHLYRSLLLTKFFTKGWGKPENLKRFDYLFQYLKFFSFILQFRQVVCILQLVLLDNCAVGTLFKIAALAGLLCKEYIFCGKFLGSSGSCDPKMG